MKTAHLFGFFFTTSCGLLACSPSQVHLDPRNVSAVDIKLATKEPTFCPGEPVRVEVRAKLKDGSTCSSADASTTCMGEKGATIDSRDVRIQGTFGTLNHAGSDLLWVPTQDVLVTAEQGISLRAWIESAGADGSPLRSPIGQIDLRPQYQCLEKSMFSVAPPTQPGQNGGAGPDLKVSATTFSTPFYPEVLLVKVEQDGRRTYIIGTDRRKPITIVSKGQDGAPGKQGTSGNNGPDGADGSSRACVSGAPGMPGGNGGLGGNGGAGGPGGAIQVLVDEAAVDKLKGWLTVGSIGGNPGRPGAGGAGGLGGRGGRHSDVQNCQAPDGAPGASGTRGVDGEPGKPGPNGPPVATATASRQALFGDDLAVIQGIEAAPKRKP
jgi:hypothetical protein